MHLEQWAASWARWACIVVAADRELRGILQSQNVASRVVESIGRWRGAPPQQVPSTAASSHTAAALAGAAYHEAANLAAFGTPIVGIGCTCALATDRMKKGDHKVPPCPCSAHGPFMCR